MKFTNNNIGIAEINSGEYYEVLISVKNKNKAKKIKQQILESQEIVERLKTWINEDIDNCLCKTGMDCTYCHNRRNLQSILGDKKE